MIAKGKKCISLLCVIILCFLSGGEALASSNDSYAPNQLSDNAVVQWVYTTSVEVNLSFVGSKAICGACVIGKASTTEITGTVVLDRKNSDGTYSTVKTWSGLRASGSMLIFDMTYYVSTGYTYRLSITSTVYQNGSGELVSGYYEAYASK